MPDLNATGIRQAIASAEGPLSIVERAQLSSRLETLRGIEQSLLAIRSRMERMIDQARLVEADLPADWVTAMERLLAQIPQTPE